MPKKSFKRCTKCGNNYTIHNYYYNSQAERYYSACKCCHRALVGKSSGCFHARKAEYATSTKQTIKKTFKKQRRITISFTF